MTVAIQSNPRVNIVSKLLTAAQVAPRFKVTAKTITRWIDEGKFPNAFKLNPDVSNSPYIIPENDVEDLERELAKQETDN